MDHQPNDFYQEEANVRQDSQSRQDRDRPDRQDTRPEQRPIRQDRQDTRPERPVRQDRQDRPDRQETRRVQRVDRSEPQGPQPPVNQQEYEGQGSAYQEGDDDHVYLMTLLSYLQEAMEFGSVVPLTGKRLVDANMCLDIIKDIRGNLPLAIQYAEQVMRDRERILVNAERTVSNKIQSADARAQAMLQDADKQARSIVAAAEDRADKITKSADMHARSLIDQNAIKIAAQNEARDILNQARADANERHAKAIAYVEDMYVSLEKELNKGADLVRSRRQQLGTDAPRDTRDISRDQRDMRDPRDPRDRDYE